VKVCRKNCTATAIKANQLELNRFERSAVSIATR